MREVQGYRIHQWGGDLQWESFHIGDPGPGEALVEVEACSIGLTVLNCIRGDLANDPKLVPRVPGHELVARVIEVGPGVAGLNLGQRVMAYFYLACGVCRTCRAGQDSLCRNLAGWVGIHRDGGYATHTVLPAGNLLPLPESLPPVTATAVPDAVATSYHVCRTRARIRPGDRVVVIGAGGGVGIHMVQMARLFGADVIGLEINEVKFPTIEDVGGRPILSRSFDEVDLHNAWGGEKPTVVIDLVGNRASLCWGLEVLDTGGRLIVLTTFQNVDFPVSPRELVFREIHLLGSRYAAKAELLEAAELVATGQIKPIISKVTTPDGIEDVHRRLHEGTLIGRGALVWHDPSDGDS